MRRSRSGHAGVDQPAEPERDLPCVAAADATIAAKGVRFLTHSDKAFYGEDMIAMPAMAAFTDPMNWCRTAFHELGYYAVIWIMPHGRGGLLDCRSRSCGGSA